MKELSIEQKARAYDEALKVLHKYDGAHIMFTQDLKEEMFPVLKESGDERVRKGLLYVIEHHPSLPAEEAEEYIAWIEKQGEQKPADKAEPKFKVGDLITNGILVGKINEIHELGYHAFFGDHYASVPDIENWHKWTIQDAKAGDVLADNYGIYIFDKFDEYDKRCFLCIGAYQYSQKVYEDERMLCSIDVRPATKEQSDLLFQKMHEAGYEWDAEHKQLKKIEHKYTPKHKVGDTIYYNSFGELKSMIVANVTTDNTDSPMYEDKEGNAVFEKDLIEQNSAWGEEDDKKAERIIRLLQEAYDINCINGSIDWLKLLKNRCIWKPSEEQMYILNWVTNLLNDGMVEKHAKGILESLYNDLKKLREE